MINLIVPDETRPVDTELLRGTANRISKENRCSFEKIRVVVATGAHSVTDEVSERARLGLADATPLHIHNCDSPHVRVGQWEYDPVLLDAERNYLLGPITFHYLAGFGGGRKLIAPGCLSRESIYRLHRSSYNADCSAPAKGTGMGRLDGNPFHEALLAAARGIKVKAIAVNVVGEGDAVEGELEESHREACERYRRNHCIKIEEKSRRVYVRQPHDTELYQAHKAIVAAAMATKEGGEIDLDADCPKGFGPGGFLEALRINGIEDHAAELRREFRVPWATALSLKRLARRFRIRIASDNLDSEILAGIGVQVISRNQWDKSEEYDIRLTEGASVLPVEIQKD